VEAARNDEQDIFPVGIPIEVRDRFVADWNRGFEVAERTPRGYRIRRLSDRYVLPREFTPDDLRHEVHSPV
jgi:hypothetical protein